MLFSNSTGLRSLFDKWFTVTFIFSILIRLIWIFSVIERDEGGLALVSLQWINGLLPYVNSFNNAGPLSYILYFVSTVLFGPNFMPIRIVNNILFFLSIVFLYLFVKSWFGREIAVLSTFIYGLFMSAPIYEGQLALTSSLSAPLVVFSIFICNWYMKYGSRKALFLASIILSSAFLVKVLVVFEVSVILGVIALRYWYTNRTNFRRKTFLNDFLVAILGFTFLPIVFTAYFALMGALSDIVNVFIGLSVVGYQKLQDVPFGIHVYVLAEGLPLWVFAAFGSFVSIVKRKMSNLFLLTWLVPAGIIALIPPHFGHRYLFLIAPASVLAGIGLASVIHKPLFKLRKVSHRFPFSSLVTILLILSVPIAFVFQLSQFPQYHINSQILEFEWIYSDASSYSTQIKLGEFLRLNCPNGGSILVHGWAAEIYYLANKLPQSKYVWTRPNPDFRIPEEEYSRLVEGVRIQEYEYIVFFDKDFDALKSRDDDFLVNETFSYYFYVGNIDNAYLFCKFYSPQFAG